MLTNLNNIGVFAPFLEWAVNVGPFQCGLLSRLAISLLFLPLSLCARLFQHWALVKFANGLRLCLACLDLMFLLALFGLFVFNAAYFASQFSIDGLLACLILVFVNLRSIRTHPKASAMFVVCLLTLLYMGLGEIGLRISGIAPSSCDPFVRFMMHNTIAWLAYIVMSASNVGTNITVQDPLLYVGQRLTWLDWFIGTMDPKDLAVRNACSFSFMVLNVAFLLSAETVTWLQGIIVIHLILCLLIGVRLLVRCPSAPFEHYFMFTMLYKAYDNIVTVKRQFGQGVLPVANTLAYFVVITVGLSGASTSYCSSVPLPNAPFPDAPEDAQRPIGEGQSLRRSASAAWENAPAVALGATASVALDRATTCAIGGNTTANPIEDAVLSLRTTVDDLGTRVDHLENTNLRATVEQLKGENAALRQQLANRRSWVSRLFSCFSAS